MFERYTEGARRVLFFARYEASQLGSASIEAEHLLLGLLRDGATGVAARTFRHAGLDYDRIRAEVSKAAEGLPKVATTVEMPLSRGCRAVLERAAEEADGLKHPHVGVDHLLLGLLYETGSLGCRRRARAVRAAPRRGAGRHCQVGVRRGGRPRFAHRPRAGAYRPRHARSVRGRRCCTTHANRCVATRGCLRFDVSQDKDDPTRWVLYEVYDSPEAHAAHRRSPHFLAYDAVAAKAVVEKTSRSMRGGMSRSGPAGRHGPVVGASTET